MEGRLLMSAKERRRLVKMEEVQAGRMSLMTASEMLGLSYRQCKRIWSRYREEGDRGLVHRSRGRKCNRGKPEQFRREVLRLYEQRYMDPPFGPTLASEKLAEEGWDVDHETLRRWLLAQGLWSKRRRRARHRCRRERKGHFGELVQMDGSHHCWFGPERGRACLVEMVDDATSRRMALMAQEETTEACMGLLRRWVEAYGIPKALYTDGKNVFVTDREQTMEEQFADQKPLTAFGKACQKLGIEITRAYSPQAKGRVERSHGVYQDRLVKEMALRGITQIQTANALLQNGFTQRLNDLFSRPPADPIDFHTPLPRGLDLADVFCFEEQRTVQNDWTVQHQNRHYQILDENRPLPKPGHKVLVRIHLDKTVQLLYRDRPLAYRALPPSELRQRLAKPVCKGRLSSRTGPAPRPAAPARPRTPWRQNCILMFADTTPNTTTKKT